MGASDLLPLAGIARAVIALAVVVGLILGTRAILRRRFTRAVHGAQRLQLDQTIALDARRRLHLVRCDGRTLLLQTGGPQDLMLGWLPEPPSTAP